jgi:small subunit ribosomal protein S21
MSRCFGRGATPRQIRARPRIPTTNLRRWHSTIGRAMRVERRDGETVEQLIRRFNKGVVSERITKTFREKMHFVSKSEQRKEKRRRAERNRRKKAMKIF